MDSNITGQFNQRKMVKNTFFSLQGGVKNNRRPQVEKMSTLNLKRISKTSQMSNRPAANTKTTYKQENTESDYPSKMSSYNNQIKFSNADDSS